MTWPFDNDTTKIVKRLAKRSIQADKRRNLFIVLTIAFAVALLTGLGFITSAQQLELEEAIRGQYQAVVVDANEALIARLSSQPEIEQWGLSQDMGSVRFQDTTLSLTYADSHWLALDSWPPVEGRLPEKAADILVEKAFLDYFQLPASLGQTLRLNLGDGEKDYTVTGILLKENDSRIFDTIVSQAYLAAQSQGEPLYEFRLRFQGSETLASDELKTAIRTFLLDQGVAENQIFFSSNYFDMQGFRSGSEQYLLPIAFLILLACSLVIYSIFYISVAGKLREYGRLKVLGATARQLRQMVRRESLYLSLRALPLGLAVGGCTAFLVRPAYWNWAANGKLALLIVLLTELAVLLSTSTPIRMAAKVSPIEAVRTTAYRLSPRTRQQKNRPLTPASLARMNFNRSRRKTVLTMISLGLTGILLISTATVAHSIDPESMAAQNMGDGSNYMLTWQDSVGLEDYPQTARHNPLTESLRKELLALEHVKNITAYSAISAQITLPQPETSDTFSILCPTPHQMAALFSEQALRLGTADYAALVSGEGIVIMDSSEHLLNRYWHYTPKLGDVLTLQNDSGQKRDFTIMGIVDANAVSSTGIGATLFVLPEESARSLYPDIDNLQIVWNIHTTADNNTLRKALFQTTTDPLLSIISRDDFAQSFKNALHSTLFLIDLLLAFLFIFALVNLINTLMTNLLSRRQELGILQSVGLSGRQLYQMLSLECLYYTIGTLLLTLLLGGASGAVLVRILSRLKLLGTLNYHFPLPEFLLFGAALLIVQIIYSQLALRYLKRQPLVEQIQAAE